jgi:hypothetical protein
MSHSTIVGGSTASRVINCPGSVKLVAQMPPRPSSSYADEGTLLHEVMAELLNNGLTKPEDFIGRRYENVELTQDLIEDKMRPAMRLLDEVDPEQMMDVLVERKVGFGDLLPGVFGSCDVIGRLRTRPTLLIGSLATALPCRLKKINSLCFTAPPPCVLTGASGCSRVPKRLSLSLSSRLLSVAGRRRLTALKSLSLIWFVL